MAIRDIRLAKLAFDIEANTKGLQGEIQSAERTFGRITKFIIANPVAAMGSLAAAALAAGAAAGRMAEQFDTAVRKVAAAIPDGTRRLEDLKRVANDLATSKGLSSDVVLSGLTAVAQEGVSGLDELITRFELLQKVADATGSDVAALAGPFDQILDVFGLTAEDLERVGARLAAISQEQGVGFTDLVGAFQSAAPVIREAGLSFDEGSSAIGRLLASGLSAKQAASELKEEVQRLGREGMLQLAGATRDASRELATLNERAALVEAGSERTGTALREKFASRVRELGDAINQNAIDPLRRLVLLLTDPVFEGKNIERGLAAVLAVATLNVNALRLALKDVRAEADQPLLGGGATSARPPLPGRFVFAPGGKPVTLGELSTADTEEAQAERLKRQRQAAESFGAELHQLLVKATATMDDDLELIIERFQARFREAAGALTAEQRAQFEFLINGLRQAKDAVLRPDATAATGTFIRNPLGLKGVSPEELAQQTEDIAQRTEREAKAAKAAADAREKSRAAVRAQADAIQRAARGAAQLAEAFGLLDRNAALALESIVDIASEVKVIAANGLSFDSALSVAGGLAALAGGLFGESADARRDRELRAQNTEAIRELTKALITEVAGRTVASTSTAVSALLAAGRGLGTGFIPGKGGTGRVDAQAVAGILDDFGLSLRDLQDQLRLINPDLQLNTSSWEDFIGSLEQARRALDEVNFQAFAATFAGQLSLLQLQFDLMDLTNPLDQLEKLRELVGGEFGSPVLDAALGGLDLTDPAQRAEAEARLLELVQRAGKKTGEGGFTAAELGGLSTQELLDLIREIEGLIDAANEQSGTTTSAPGQTSFGVVSQATGVQVDRLIGLAVSQDGHLVEIRDLLAGFAPVLPPVLPDVLLPTIGTMELTVVVEGPVTPDNAAAVGQTVGAAAAAELARASGARLTRARLVAGDATVTR